MNFTPPSPPEGCGSVLEYHHYSKSHRRYMTVAMPVFILVMGSLIGALRGFGWFFWGDYPYLLALPVLGGVLVYFGTGSVKLIVGADWAKFNSKRVDTYDLVKIKATVAGPNTAIELTDRQHRKLWIKANLVQENPKAWDLIYNGILYSMEHGAVATGTKCHAIFGFERTDV